MDDKYKNLRILVVDDHMMMRTLIRQHLEGMGFTTIDTANDGSEALEKLRTSQDVGNPYNLVFLDWHMPDVEGFDVLKECREKPDWNKTAFVMLTAEQEEKNVLKAVQAGATSYLVKPVAKEALEKNLQKVFAWLEKQGYEFSSKAQNAVGEVKTRNKFEMPAELQKELGPVISKGMRNIFSELFQVSILENNNIEDHYKKQMVCIGRLYQEGVVIDLRFFFDKSLLRPLLENIYAPGFLDSDEVFADAAAEIVNILCSQIKAFMNKKGFTLEMDIPEMGVNEKKSEDSDAILNVCFSMSQDECFLVDLGSKAT